MAINLDLMSPRLERALWWAAVWHDGQHRKASPVPYVQHPVAVAWMLDRLGFEEDVVIAALLHDAVEDTEATLEEVRVRFGDRVAELVAHCSEVKLDAEGKKRAWEDRKRDHLEALQAAPIEAKAIVLADTLHNLKSMAADLEEGPELWQRFNASKEQVLGYARAKVERLGEGVDSRLEALARRCREVLDGIDRKSEGEA